MIPERDTSVKVQSNIQGESQAMGIAVDAWNHVMGILADMYKDPERALIREYSTNGRDSHIAAGRAHIPIEVTLPNDLAPELRIKDYGLGLDFQDIKETYSQYGASTKRGSNDVTGMLGIGCKCALAYTNQFIVIGVKDGTRIEVMVQRDEEGAGSMSKVSEAPTDEPNGVEIIISARKINAFARKAAEFFRFWEPGTVLIDGVEPNRIDGLWLDDDMVIIEEENADTIVMGGVPYPIDRYQTWDYIDAEGKQQTFQFLTGLTSDRSLVAFLPIGAIHFHNSREALRETDRTKTALQATLVDFKERMKGQVQHLVNKAATPADALAVAIKWHKILPKIARAEEYTYKGHKLPSEFRIEIKKSDGTLNYEKITVAPKNRQGYKLTTHSRDVVVPMESWPNALWVYGYEKTSFTPTTRKKLDKYCADNGIEVSRFLLVEKKPKSIMRWLDKSLVIPWTTIEEIKLPRATMGGKTADPNRIPGSYDMYIGGVMKRGVPANDIDQTNPIYWLEANTGWRYAQCIHRHEPNATVVELTSNRIDKFRRNFPQAVKAREAVERLYKVWHARVTNAEDLAIRIQTNGVMRMLKPIDPAKVTDPKLKQAAKLARLDIKKLIEERNEFPLHPPPMKKKTEKWENPLDNYPLYDSYQMNRHRHADHLYLYMNAVHAYEGAK